VHLKRCLRFLMEGRVRLKVAVVCHAASWLGWPLSIWLTQEPPFILSLSWFAIIYATWNDISTAILMVKQDDGDSRSSS
jgi:hypothetical protein